MGHLLFNSSALQVYIDVTFAAPVFILTMDCRNYLMNLDFKSMPCASVPKIVTRTGVATHPAERSSAQNNK